MENTSLLLSLLNGKAFFPLEKSFFLLLFLEVNKKVSFFTLKTKVGNLNNMSML